MPHDSATFSGTFAQPPVTQAVCRPGAILPFCLTPAREVRGKVRSKSLPETTQPSWRDLYRKGWQLVWKGTLRRGLWEEVSEQKEGR